ncbi:MAG: DUF1320 family protein [Bacteroidales bacterium]|nr:DUF1320 family protein [Bacteroidales bacterium]
MFLEKAELKTVADIALVDLITGLDDVIITDIISQSTDLMKSYMGEYYAVDTIFAAEGDSRNLTVLKYLKDIVIYEINTRYAQFNEVLRVKYEDVMRWLENLNTGKFTAGGLPLKTGVDAPEGQADFTIRYNSQPKYNPDF